MITVKIKGNEYKLGDMPFTDENLDLVEELMVAAVEGKTSTAKSSDDMTADDVKQLIGFSRKVKRLLGECLMTGNEEAKAKQAIADLGFSLSPDSDLQNCVQALMSSIGGK